MNNQGEAFTCDVCGGTFSKGRDDDAANAEAFELFGVKDAATAEGMATICDSCWRQMVKGGAFDVTPPDAS